MKWRSLLVATAAAASSLLACASILGIDDVHVRATDAETTATDAQDEISEETSTLIDAAVPTDAPIAIDAGPCKVCSGAGEVTACALACDLPEPSAVVIDDIQSYVYFTSAGLDANGAGSSAWKVQLAGSVPPVLLEDAGVGRPNAIAYAPARKCALYSVPGASSIHVSDGGSSGASPWASVTLPSTIAVASGGSGGVAFYKTGATNDLETTSVDAPASATQYVGEPITDFSVSIVAGKIGWSTTGSPNNLDFGPVLGGASTPLVGGQVAANHVALNNAASTTFAWSARPSAGVTEIRANGTGGTTSTVLWTGKSVGGMQFAPDDDAKLYFTDTIAGTVSVISSGGTASVIADSQDSPGGIWVGPSWIVWVDRGSSVNSTGRVMRIGR